MKTTWYRVEVIGENAWLDIDDELTAVGFIVTRFVQARDVTEAQRKGLEAVSDELKSKVVSGTELGVRLTIKACEPLEASEKAPAVAPGFMWFPGEDGVQH